MTFATDIAKIPFAARGTNAAGFLPPIFRAATHILFAAAAMADPREDLITDEEVLGELNTAKGLWDVIATTEALSTPTAQLVTDFGACLTSAHAEFTGWTTDQKHSNFRDLANRVAAITATLDRELIGIRDTDPGYQI